MSRGEHLKVRRTGYTHHAIDRGDGTVIELTKPVLGGTVRIISLADFGVPADISRVAYRECAPAEVTVGAAMSMVGKTRFDLWANNCEHFATWCKTGVAASAQIENLKATAKVTAVAAGILWLLDKYEKS